MADLIKPEVQVFVADGEERTYIISKFPAIAGREIIAMYPLTAMPKIGDYKANEEALHKLMAFVEVVLPNGSHIRLTTAALIDTHVPSWEMLAKIEFAMINYNCSFFRDGRVSTFLKDFAQKLPAWITKILTDLSARSFPKGKQPSESLENTTR